MDANPYKHLLLWRGLMESWLEAGGFSLQQSFENVGVCCCETCCQISLTRSPRMRHHAEARSSDKESSREGRDLIHARKYSPIGEHPRVRAHTATICFCISFRHVAIRKPGDSYVVENVPGMREFPVVMEAMTKLATVYYVQSNLPGE
jgi:DNA (cytosine-5)-methyltransferase 1